MGVWRNIPVQFKKDASQQKVPEERINSTISFLSTYNGLPHQKRSKLLLEIIANLELLNQENIQRTKPSKISEPKAAYKKKGFQSDTRSSEQKIKSNKSSKHTYIDLETGLESPLLSIPSVGPSKAKTFQNIGVFTLEDLLYYFPRKYEDFRELKRIENIQYGEKITILGKIKSANLRSTKNIRFKLTELIIEDGSGTLRIKFLQPTVFSKKI